MSKGIVLALALAAVLFPAVALGNAIIDFEVAQLSYPDQGVPNSDWGEITFNYTGVAVPLYLNVRIVPQVAPFPPEGFWTIENFPVFSYDGNGVNHSLSMTFSLGVQTDSTPNPNVPLSSVTIEATLKYGTTSVQPPNLASVGSVIPVVGKAVVAGGKAAAAAIPPANRKVAKGTSHALGGLEWSCQDPSKLTNIECKHNQCVQCAIHNSLTMLKAKNNIPDNVMDPADFTPDALDGPLFRTPCQGTGAAWPTWKDTYMKSKGFPIVTKYHNKDAGGTKAAMDKIAEGCDVELDGANHVAAVLCMLRVKWAPELFYLIIRHDRKQKACNDTAADTTGGLTDEVRCYNATTGQFSPSDGFINTNDGWVSECYDPTITKAPPTPEPPTTPEPTPEPTDDSILPWETPAPTPECCSEEAREHCTQIADRCFALGTQLNTVAVLCPLNCDPLFSLTVAVSRCYDMLEDCVATSGCEVYEH